MQLARVLPVLVTLLASQVHGVWGECSKGPYAGFVGALSSLEHGVGTCLVTAVAMTCYSTTWYCEQQYTVLNAVCTSDIPQCCS